MSVLDRLGSTTFSQAAQAITPFLPQGFRKTLVGVSAIGLISGLLEAGILAAIGSLAAQLEGESDASQIELPLIGEASWQLAIGAAWLATFAIIGLRLLNSQVITRLSLVPLVTVRERLISSYLTTSSTQQNAERSGELQDLLLTHAPRIGFIALFSANALVSWVMIVVLAATAAIVNVYAFLAMLAVVTLVLLLSIPVQRISQGLGVQFSEATSAYATDATEVVDAATEVQLFDAHAVVADRLDRSSRHVAAVIQRLQVILTTNPTMYRMVVLALLLSGLAGLVASGVNDVAAAGAGALLMLRALLESQSIHRQALNVSEYLPSVQEVESKLAEYRDSETPQGERELDKISSLALSDVSFRYEGEQSDALKHVSLHIGPSDRVGIGGPSGAGKSTLLSMMLGLLQPTTGTVSINGRAVSEYTAASRARQVSVVSQVPHLVTNTVAENIRFFRDWITDEDVRWAAAAAGISAEIESMPQGFETVIGQRGARSVSGGQSQRICIARALAGRPSLLVLDEPTSSLDVSAEEVVATTFASLGDSCAVVLVSHRETALEACERRVVLTDGSLTDIADPTA